MSRLQILMLLLTSTSHVRSMSTTQFAQGLRAYTAEPTALVQFVPFMNTDIPTSMYGYGFANAHITKILAGIPSSGSLGERELKMQTANTGEYSLQVAVFDIPFIATTYMSCSGAAEETVRTCEWSVESGSSRYISQEYTHTDTGLNSVVSTWTYTSGGATWDNLGTSTFTSTVLIHDHLHTIDLDVLVHRKTSTTAATSTRPLSLSMTT